MNPLLRTSVAFAFLAGACWIARAMWPAVSLNLLARSSWTRTTGEVRSLNGAAEFELGTDSDSRRALVKVDHYWGLSLFHQAPLFVAQKPKNSRSGDYGDAALGELVPVVRTGFSGS